MNKEEKPLVERSKEFAERHQEAEMNLRGLGATYGYQRIYNAEICAYERGSIDQKDIDIELINTLVDTLYQCRATILGITALDSEKEIERKNAEGDCAIIRAIDRNIALAKSTMETK